MTDMTARRSCLIPQESLDYFVTKIKRVTPMYNFKRQGFCTPVVVKDMSKW